MRRIRRWQTGAWAAAAGALVAAPSAFALWTDLTLPFGDDGRGRALAEAIATAIGGRIAERR